MKTWERKTILSGLLIRKKKAKNGELGYFWSAGDEDYLKQIKSRKKVKLIY